MRCFLVSIFYFTISITCFSQVSKVWVADQGNGTYKNPILHADYSDPDVCRVGDDYYMISSSFNASPGLPILHSQDLVNWKLIGHALPRLQPIDHFSSVQHGNGVWASSIRFHNDEFWIYYPDPDYGIYLTKAKQPDGPWSEPILVEGGKGLIDPCPLWDEDGENYLVHAYAGSRAGIKSVLVIKKLNNAGTKTIDAGRIVYDGHEKDPTIEGPKIYKRNGYYYIFAPAGGVKTGWQLVLRSKNIYGPYERRVVMDQGSTEINGPHQGAWVDTSSGEHWFIHFQDKGAYGRIVHLQPIQWTNNWPVIGIDKDEDGKGEPVLNYKKPAVTNTSIISTPIESDEFNSNDLGLQWQWQANPKVNWFFMNSTVGMLRLYSQKMDSDYWQMPNLLLQKIPSEEFTATVKLTFKPNPKLNGEQSGLILLGEEYGAIGISHSEKGLAIVLERGDAKTGSKILNAIPTTSATIYFRIELKRGGVYFFSYSIDGKKYLTLNEKFMAVPGKWVGAKLGVFCIRKTETNDAGYADIDWFRIESLN